jgi:ATP-binding cassette subfamily B protein
LEAVERAVRIVGAGELISALPDGYQTLIMGDLGGRGIQLSPGQCQLLALARALVRNPEILIFDEASSALDSASESAFRAALRAETTARRPVILTVAQRLAAAREADRVIVLDRGRIVEMGSPDELMRAGGRFAAMLELESAGWNWHKS